MLHEGLLLLFRNRPSLAPELLTGPLGQTLPAWSEVQVAPAELNQVVPTEYRADLVVLLLLSAAARRRLLACTDLSQLRRWLRRAATAQSVQELFAPGPMRRPSARESRKPRPSGHSGRRGGVEGAQGRRAVPRGDALVPDG
jgi:hypothetical protein